jgi:hypothetical protein
MPNKQREWFAAHSILLSSADSDALFQRQIKTFRDWGNEVSGMESAEDILCSFDKKSRLYEHAAYALGQKDPLGVYADGDPELASLAKMVNSLCEIDYTAQGGATGAQEQRLKIIAASKAKCLKQKATPFCRAMVDAVTRSIALVDAAREGVGGGSSNGFVWQDVIATGEV